MSLHTYAIIMKKNAANELRTSKSTSFINLMICLLQIHRKTSTVLLNKKNLLSSLYASSKSKTLEHGIDILNVVHSSHAPRMTRSTFMFNVVLKKEIALNITRLRNLWSFMIKYAVIFSVGPKAMNRSLEFLLLDC